MVALAEGIFTRRNSFLYLSLIRLCFEYTLLISWICFLRLPRPEGKRCLLFASTCYIKKQNDRELFASHLSGRTPEELLPSLRGRLFYKELHHAVTDGLQAKLFSDEGKKSFCFYLVVVLLLVVCCVRLSLLRA